MLRNGGLAVHCTWMPGVRDLGDALEPDQSRAAGRVHMTAGRRARRIAAVRDHVAPSVPLIVVRDRVDEAVMTEDAVPARAIR